MSDVTKAPCECRFGVVDDLFVMEPCSPTCEIYAYAITQARKQGKEISQPIELTDSGKFEAFIPRCSHCKAQLDGFTGARGATPVPGDYSLCEYCGEFSIYGDDDMRKPTKRELRIITDVAQNRHLQKAVKANLMPYRHN